MMGIVLKHNGCSESWGRCEVGGATPTVLWVGKGEWDWPLPLGLAAQMAVGVTTPTRKRGRSQVGVVTPTTLRSQKRWECSLPSRFEEEKSECRWRLPLDYGATLKWEWPLPLRVALEGSGHCTNWPVNL